MCVLNLLHSVSLASSMMISVLSGFIIMPGCHSYILLLFYTCYFTIKGREYEGSMSMIQPQTASMFQTTYELVHVQKEFLKWLYL